MEREDRGKDRQRSRGRWGLKSDGCLETVVKETKSPRVLWHLSFYLSFFQSFGVGCFVFFPEERGTEISSEVLSVLKRK